MARNKLCTVVRRSSITAKLTFASALFTLLFTIYKNFNTHVLSHQVLEIRYEKQEVYQGTIKEFQSDRTKIAVLLSYQRCGSTFVGGIFNQNEKAFYMFEPVDGIYSSIYGTLPGFNVPSDLYNYWNGTQRVLPEAEITRVADVMTSLLSCRLSEVPTEVLLHRFLFLFRKQHSSLVPYKQCLRAHNISIASISNCWKTNIKAICEDRFGSNIIKQEKCRNALNNINTSRDVNYNSNITIGEKDSIGIADYGKCLSLLRNAYDTCSPYMADMCTSSELIATKTVRLTMASAELMIPKLPNMRIIHLIRDPRAVALSRMVDPTYRGKKSTNKPVREADFYCKSVLRDIVIKKRIDKNYPGTVMQVIYEDIAKDPLKVVGTIYSFLNETIPPGLDEWLTKTTGGSTPEKSLQIAQKWQNKLTYKTSQEIGSACRELFEIINHDWPAI